MSRPEAGDEHAAPARRYGGETLAERRADQRTRLLSAAIDVFDERGYAAASVDEIVARARVSRTTFYRSFGSLENCMLAIVEERIGELAATVAAAVAAAATPIARVRAGIAALVAGFALDPPATRVLLIEVVGATPRLESARIEARAGFSAMLTAGLEQVPGWTDRAALERETAAMATMGAVAEAVSHHASLGDLEMVHGRLAEMLCAYALRALAPPAAWSPADR